MFEMSVMVGLASARYGIESERKEIATYDEVTRMIVREIVMDGET